jgi:hypothetical protein
MTGSLTFEIGAENSVAGDDQTGVRKSSENGDKGSESHVHAFLR